MKEQYRSNKQSVNDSGAGNFGNIGYYPNQHAQNVPYMPPGMGYGYGTQPQFFPPQPMYHQAWYGYNQGVPSSAPVYVDVTQSSKINYDDDDDDDDDDDADDEKDVQQQEQLLEEKWTRHGNEEEKRDYKEDVPEIIAHVDSEESSRQDEVDGSHHDNKKEQQEDEDQEGEDQEDEQEVGDKVDKTEDKAIYIPGTSIVLKTDDDIAKWKEERRKMWLIKISNNKEAHRQKLNIKEEELHSNTLQESKKERNFIQNIQNQVKRFHPKSSLTIGLHQRILKEENSKILDFIKELGDANYLKYELTEEEKGVLFGNRDRRNDNNKRFHSRYDHQANGRGHNSNNTNNYSQNRKKRHTAES